MRRFYAPLCIQYLSTNWQNENFVMGRATLSSHYGKNEKEIHNNVGYWGANFEPVVFDERFPDWLRRKSWDKHNNSWL